MTASAGEEEENPEASHAAAGDGKGSGCMEDSPTAPQTIQGRASRWPAGPAPAGPPERRENTSTQELTHMRVCGSITYRSQQWTQQRPSATTR